MRIFSRQKFHGVPNSLRKTEDVFGRFSHKKKRIEIYWSASALTARKENRSRFEGSRGLRNNELEEILSFHLH